MADTALNPKQLIGNIIGRPLEFYHGLTGREKHAKVSEILEMVELPPAFASRYPMELSGGQKQRINLARSLAANPEVMLCDEVTSALDSIVGANVIKLLTNLRDKTGVSFVFISHDLSTVASFADEIVVLYAGRVVEQGPDRRSAAAAVPSVYPPVDQFGAGNAHRLARRHDAETRNGGRYRARRRNHQTGLPIL